MSPAEGERRLISEITANLPSERRSADANDGPRGTEESSRASSASDTGRISGAISRRFQSMISVSLSDMKANSRKAAPKSQETITTSLGSALALFERFCGHRLMSAIDDLLVTMARLREPGGCPWDQEQTHASLVRCLIDEVSELIDTIDRADMPHMREELGDVLIQIVFHARMAEEKGLFNFDDVARDINDKLVRRHPHVFGSDKLNTSEQVIVQWDAIKALEKKNGPARSESTIFKDLPPRLPALMFAEAIWKQIEKKALPVPEIVDKRVISATGDQLDEETLGQKLFELAAAARVKGLDPEEALRLHATKVMNAVETQVTDTSKGVQST
jgi:XTP/dITP diphosphohydrolase/tetrapyrrole methylase family protein/MazG family protein